MTEKLQEIITMNKNQIGSGWWIILSCGHWYKWSAALPPKTDIGLRCPQEHHITVVSEK